MSNITASLPSLDALSSVLSSPAFSSLSASARSTSWKAYAASLGLGYLALCQLLRFRREKAMRRKYGYPDRESLKAMTVEDAQNIIKDLACLEFPQFMETSLQFALFKTYGVETISKMLLATRNLTDPVASLKRYEDTGVLIGEFMSQPPNSKRATTAVARMNWLHSKYIQSGQISNEDLLYTLSVFITEPARFMRLYEWRPMNEMEHCALGVFWRSIGDAMGIQWEGHLSKTSWRDGLDFAEDVAQWAKAYEVVAFKPSTISNKPARALIPMITYWAPSWSKNFAAECVHALLGDRVRDAFMLPEPSVVPTAAITTAIALRRFVVRHLCLPRVFPLQRHQQNTDAVDKPLHVNWNYGNYPFYNMPTFWKRWGPQAWLIWIAGGKLPGDEPAEYLAKGFTFTDLGPRNRMGKGQADMDEDFKRLQAKGMGGCPFG